MNWDELPGLFPALAEPERWLPLLKAHLAYIAEAGEHTRVTAVAPDDAIQRQYAESLETWRIAVEALGAAPPEVVDVGSGGGYPGLVVACVAPETRVSLVEPLQKRARLLEAVASALGLANVEVFAQRAEEAGRGRLRETATLVTARAVAALPELLEYTTPFARAGGIIALPKGSAMAGELAAATSAMRELGCEPMDSVAMRPAISKTVSVALLRKVAGTPERYPRRPGVPGKRPL